MKETVSELLQSALATLQSEGTLPADQTFTPQATEQQRCREG